MKTSKPSPSVTERQDRITALARELGPVGVPALAAAVGVSESIIRRDIAELRLDGEIVPSVLRGPRGTLQYVKARGNV